MYAEDIHATYKLLAHQAPLELRALKVHADGRTACIRDCLVHSSEQLVKVCEAYDGVANIYVGLRERRRKFTPGRGLSAKKQDISAVTTLVIDLDPVRPQGLEKQATTEAELNAAIAEAQYQRDLIAKRGFVPPLLAMSGNGCQLWFFIPRYELSPPHSPTSTVGKRGGWYAVRKNPETGEKVLTHTFESRLKAFEEKVRQSLSKGGKEKVKVDSIYDLPRIIKVIGTMSVKGDAIKYPNRPHRVSRWLDTPIRQEDRKLLAYLLDIPVQADTLNFTENQKLPQIFLDALASDSKLRKLWYNPPQHGDTSVRDWAIGLACLEHGIHEPQMLFDILSQKPHGKYQRDGYVPYLHITVSNLLVSLSQQEESPSQLHLKFGEKIDWQLFKEAKLKCFISLFQGRTDVFAKRWEKKDGSKSGYSPACHNEWASGICKKGTGQKCDKCDKREYITLSEEYIEQHLRGQITIGLYPLLKDNTSYFLAVDFDGADWTEQAKRFVEVCAQHGLPAYVERSRSGNGAHVWFFFSDAYPAYKSRKIAFALLGEAGIVDEFTKVDSFDRLFPNQDYHTGKGFGNLIALPLQYGPRQKGNSVFVDFDTPSVGFDTQATQPKDVANDFKPYPDQWEILTTVQRITPEVLDALFDKFTDASKEETSSEGKHREPPILQLTLRNHIIIPKVNLPKKLTDFLREELNFVNSKYIINQRLGKSNYKTERYFQTITHDDHSIMIPRGFLNRLIQFLDENEIDFLVCDERQQLNSIDLEPTYKLFPHQAKALQHFENKEDGILVAPPGSGKTIMGLELIVRKKQPALIIVHRKQIFQQWIKRIEDFLDIPKKHIGQFGGQKKKIQTPITISMIQSLSRCKELNEISQNFGMVLVDECHHIPAKMFRSVITQLNPYYLFGLTATPKRKHNDEKLIFIYLGDIVYEVPKDYNHEVFSMKDTLMIHIRNTDFSMPFQVKTDDFHLLTRTLILDRMRNELIVKDVSEHARLGYKCLVLTERKEHVDILNLYLKRSFEVIQLTGDLSARKRKEVEKQIHSGHFQILIATGQLIGEGTDFPNLDCLFLVYPFSFEGKLIQYIGRIEHGESESTAQGRFIFDYRDSKVSVLEEQFKKRNRYYKKLHHAIILQD